MPCPSPCPGVCPGHVNYISDAIQPSHPLMASPPSALSLSQYQGLFQWVIHLSTSDDQKYWSFSISPFSEYSGLISLKIDWFELLAVQWTFRSLLQHHSSKASVLWLSAFFTVQHSQLYVTSGKTIALTIQTFVGRVMSLNLNLSSTLEKTSPALWEQNYKRYEIFANWYRHLM